MVKPNRVKTGLRQRASSVGPPADASGASPPLTSQGGGVADSQRQLYRLAFAETVHYSDPVLHWHLKP